MTTAKKRTRREDIQIPKEETEPMLKCHEMRLIFQRLPTSELIRFISNQPKHPLGKFWSQELKFVVEKRLPFSIEATATTRGAVADHVIYDCNGSRVAKIKRPMQFHLSPIAELIESADVPAFALNASNLPPQVVFPTPDVFSTFKSLDTLVLSAHYATRRALRDPVDLLAALSPEVMSRIKALTLANRDLYRHKRFGKPTLEIISRAANLKELRMPYVEQNALALLAALPSHRDDYSGLESLRVKLLNDYESVLPLLEIIATRFNGLHELFLPVEASIRQYLAAFQALPSLTTLGLSGLDLYDDKKWLSVDDNDLSIVSVTELYVALHSYYGSEPRALLAVLSKFPNVRTFGAEDYRNVNFLLRCLTSAVCSSRVFTHLEALKLFSNASYTSDELLQFIRANIDHLPRSVDLSQVKTDRPRNVDRDFLFDLCLALQVGNITSLAFKDLVHREAVTRLREHFALTKQDKSTPQANGGKVLAWIDAESAVERRRRIRSAGGRWPQAVSEFTDFRIEACKTSGPLKGSASKVRISDWTEERERLFDEELD